MSTALQVFLDDADFLALRSWAKGRGWTLSQAVRVAVKALTRPPEDDDPLLAASGMIAGLPPDLSHRVDEYLSHSYVAEPIARYGTPARKQKRKRNAAKPVRR